MTTLKRKYAGYYEVVTGCLRVSISKSNNEWESCVEVFSHIAKDFEGTEVNIYNVVGENQFSRTKKEAYNALQYQIEQL